MTIVRVFPGSGPRCSFRQDVVHPTLTQPCAPALDVTFVIPNGCNHCLGDDEPLFLAGLKSNWFPFALSEAGLLAGLLLASCRSLLARVPAGDDDPYARMALRYRGECIKSTNDAIVAEGLSISDATIAKAVVMASGEVSCPLACTD